MIVSDFWLEEKIIDFVTAQSPSFLRLQFAYTKQLP